MPSDGHDVVARSDGYLLPRRATRVAIGGVLIGLLLGALNQTIVITALPQIAADLDAFDQYAWVLTSFLLALTVATPIVGRLSDIYGRRPFLLCGIVVFIGGGIISAAATNIGWLVGGRVLQGLGSSALIPLAAVVIGDLVPPSDRGRWQGLVGAVTGVAAVLGPTVGGWIADNANWRWVFLASLPFAAIAFVVVALTLRIPPHPERGTRVDYLGAVLLAAGVSILMLAVVGSVPGAAWLYVAGACLLALLIAWELRVEQPIIPVDLFRGRIFTFACIASLLTGVSIFVTITYTPLFVQGALGKSATSSALALTPIILAMTVASAFSGQVITRTGRYRWALVSGAVLVGAAGAGMASLDAFTGQAFLTVTMICAGLGFGFVIQNLVLVIQNAVPSRHLGAATAASRFFHTIGGTIGIAVTGAVVAAHLPTGLPLDGLAGRAESAGGLAIRELVVDAIHPVFLILVPVAACLLAFALLIPERPLRRAVRDDVHVQPASESAVP